MARQIAVLKLLVAFALAVLIPSPFGGWPPISLLLWGLVGDPQSGMETLRFIGGGVVLLGAYTAVLFAAITLAARGVALIVRRMGVSSDRDLTAIRTRYFHEDDSCQQEFLPLSNWEHCASQVREIDAFSDAHRFEHGWTDIYMRRPAPTALADLAVAADDVATAALTPFTSVTTGYGTHVEPCPDVRAFGRERGLTLFLKCNTNGLVTALWLDPWGLEAREIPAVVEILASLPKAEELLFVDWAWSRLFQATDRDAWRAYLDEHSRQVGAPA